MLDTLFSNKMDAASKKRILEKEHHMKMTRNLEGGIETMCNVSLGIREQALEEGREEGEKRKLRELIQKKLAKGQSLEMIAEVLEEDVETIQSLIQECNISQNNV